MGKQFNVYDRPVTREEYDYLRLHCQTYLISENEKMFGPVGKAEGHEWPEEELPENEPVPVEVEEQAIDGPVHEDWDADDVKFVDGLDYSQKQAWLKANDLPAGGSKPELRQRMLEALRDAEEVEDDDETEEENDD